jgi:hypothetical protein
VEPGNVFVISKVDFVCDIIDESILMPLPQNYNHFLSLSAPPRSGKSAWIMNCLCKSGKVYNTKFGLAYIVSPSLKTAKDDPFQCLPLEQIESELTVDFIDRFINDVSESGKRVLILLDDVVNDIRKIKGSTKLSRNTCTTVGTSRPTEAMRRTESRYG